MTAIQTPCRLPYQITFRFTKFHQLRHDHTTPFSLKFKILSFMYLVYLSKLPKNIQCFYVRNIPDHDLRKPLYYKKKKINSCLMKMCMSVYGIDLLQKNISMIQNSENLCIYKRKYKDKLLANHKE